MIMNSAVKRAIGLTSLILLLAVAVWIVVYFGYQTKKPVQESASENTKLESNQLTQTLSASSSFNTLDLSIQAGDFLPNPFGLPATSTYAENRDWAVVDGTGDVIASGTIPGLLSSYSAYGEVYWYDKLPSSEKGELLILATEFGPQLIIPIKLQTKTQTAEIYFRNAALSNCGSVDPVKRTIVSTGENDLYFYESALRELLKGPTKSEADKGLITMIPADTKVLRVGKNDKGRYVADFTQDLQDPNQIDCFWSIAKNQIQKTLSTVPLPGTTLDGVILINGEPIK
jgi:hypothetical protein